jgi:hypothetical protein
MNRIGKMREAADLLVGKYRYGESYTIYDELYRQICGVFGTVQGSYCGYSKNSFKSTIPYYSAFHERCIETAADALCLRMYNTPLSQILDEFIRIIYGHLQCISFSREVNKEIVTDDVLSEFAVLYTLVLQRVQHRKITPVFAVVSIVLDGNRRLKRIRSNYSRSTIERLLIESAEKNKDDEWRVINSLLLEYLSRAGNQKTELYAKIKNIIGNWTYRYKQKDSNWYNNEQYKYYERYERFEKRTSSTSKEFCPATATEAEKMAYYGRLIDLKGKVTIAQIRSKYINLVSLYHPDKVQHLGPELKELAERKSKEINAAYDWLKSRYRI